MRSVFIHERPTSPELLEQAEIAEANAREADANAKSWRLLAEAFRKRAEKVT